MKLKPRKRKEKPAPESRTQIQGGVYKEVPRNFIHGAEWNPRQISSYARSLLKKKLATVGCVTPLVWNERSSILISGHQRLAILDELEGSHDYIVGVTAVDVDEKTEREMNVSFNNRQSQGDFEVDKFLTLVIDGKLDLEEAGMTRIDLEIEFGQLPELNGIFASEAKTAERVADELNQIAAVSPYRAEFRKRQKEAIQSNRQSPASDASYYVVVVFEEGKLKPWLKEHGFSETVPYLLASQIMHLVKKPEPVA